MDKLDEVRQKLLDKTMKDLVNPETWDMERMAFLIDQSIQEELVKVRKIGNFLNLPFSWRQKLRRTYLDISLAISYTVKIMMIILKSGLIRYKN